MRSFQNLSKISGIDIDRLKKLMYQKTFTNKDIKEFKNILDRLIRWINLLNIIDNIKPLVQIETTYDSSSSEEEEEEEEEEALLQKEFKEALRRIKIKKFCLKKTSSGVDNININLISYTR